MKLSSSSNFRRQKFEDTYKLLKDESRQNYQFVTSQHNDWKASEENLQRSYENIDISLKDYQKLSNSYKQQKEQEQNRPVKLHQQKQNNNCPQYVKDQQQHKYQTVYYHPGKLQPFGDQMLWSCCLREQNQDGCTLFSQKLI